MFPLPIVAPNPQSKFLEIGQCIRREEGGQADARTHMSQAPKALEVRLQNHPLLKPSHAQMVEKLPETGKRVQKSSLYSS